MNVSLAHQIFVTDPGQAQRTAFILHGIWGSGRNWVAMARRLAKTYPGWRFVTIDLPAHGESQVPPGTWSIERCADALLEFSERHPVQALIGHSFGGKVALAFAHRAQVDLKSVWLLDSSIGDGRTATGDAIIETVQNTIQSAPLPALHREEVVRHFIEHGSSLMIARWMTTNLRREDDGFRWRFQPKIVNDLLEDYRRVNGWQMLERVQSKTPVHVVLAGRSQWWRGESQERLKILPGVATYILPDAGHWVHIDRPDELVEMLAAL